MAATGPVMMLAAAKVDLELASARRSTQAFYEDHAERYAQATLSQSMQPQLDRFLDIAPVGPILDLGCGAGRDLKVLTQAGRPAIGLDLSWALARMARSFAASPVVVGDMRCPPVASASLAGVRAPDHTSAPGAGAFHQGFQIRSCLCIRSPRSAGRGDTRPRYF
ncbi:class I SAM-dependent methyltransferase [Caulobacter sp. BE254]|uniref:class I SAM-dependent methyltransferase n=1 Tax=Caulobacter sp. BE254 TaxID=2817720 RepID=UPI003857200F